MNPINFITPPLTQYLPEGRTFSSPFAETIAKTGRSMIEPLNIGLELAVRTVMHSWSSNTHGRREWVVLELFRRVVWAAKAACLITFGLLTAILGTFLLALGNSYRKNFTYIQPSTPFDLSVERQQFKLTTFNFGGLPEWAMAINRLRPVRERVAEFINYVNDRQDADCICVQELFDQTSIASVVEGCKRKYPYIIANVAPQTFGLYQDWLTSKKFNA